jgi:hypothetical protein
MGIGAAIWAGVHFVWGYAGSYVIGAVISYGISYAATALFGKDPKADMEMDKSLKENLEGATNPIPVVYGRRTLGGTKVFVDTTGSSNTRLHTVLSLAEGEINSIENVYLDDKLITDSKFNHLAWNYNHTGSDTQTVDASLNGLIPDKWTENHRLQGVAYVYVRLKFDRDAFSRIPNITADIKGLKVYDPRTETTIWSDNPALCIRDYLTNTRYGRGIPEDMIDDDAIIAAANYCEQQVSFKDPSGSSYNDNRYRCNGALNIDDSSLDNVKKLLSSCRGMLIFSAGKYKLVIDKPETAAYTFDEDVICGEVTISLGDKSVVFNRMRIRYFDQDLKWEQNIYTYDNETLRTSQDNGLILEGELELPFTSEIVRAEQIAQMEVKRSRQSIVCSFDATLEALQNDVGDVVNLTYPRAGWENKKFRVIKIGLKSEDSVEVALKEYDDSTYSLDVWTPPSEPDTLNPGGWNYDPPNNVTATSGNTELLIAGDGSLISRIRLVWDSPENGYCTGYEVGFKLSSESNYTDFSTSETTHIFSPVQDGVDYDLRVRAVFFNGGKSSWVNVENHTVQGKSALPDTPSGFAVSNEANNVKKFVWDEVDNLDLRGYRIRYKSGTTGEWGDMTALHSGNLAGSPWETSSISNTGDYRFGLVSVDRSGNESIAVYYNLTLETTGSGGGTAPNAPTGLTATGGFNLILLEWTNPTENFDRAEIWASTDNDRSNAVKRGETGAGIYALLLDGEQTLYFWVRGLNSSGAPGPFNAGETSGVSGTSSAETTTDQIGDATITNAKIASLSAAKITAGTIGAHTIQLDGASSIIQSSNFATGSTGWQIKGNGVAEFLDAIIRGTVSSGGAIQSSDFQTGVQGWQISGDGNAEFNSVNIRGEVAVPQLKVGLDPAEGGYFFDAFVLDCYAANGTTARYTTNGNPPSETGAVFPSSGLNISTTTTVRVIAFEDLTGRQSEEQILNFEYITHTIEWTSGTGGAYWRVVAAAYKPIYILRRVYGQYGWNDWYSEGLINSSSWSPAGDYFSQWQGYGSFNPSGDPAATSTYTFTV